MYENKIIDFIHVLSSLKIVNNKINCNFICVEFLPKTIIFNFVVWYCIEFNNFFNRSYNTALQLTINTCLRFATVTLFYSS